MSATWFLVRHVPDLRRREPRNIGVVLRSDDGQWRAKFVGEQADGGIRRGTVPRAYGLNFDVYQSWHSFFRRKLDDESWTDVERLQKSRRSSYFAEPGGKVFADGLDWSAELNRLFDELVSLPERARSETVLKHIRRAVDEIFDRVEINVSRDVSVPIEYDGRIAQANFRYGYKNDGWNLMDIVQHSQSPGADARELRSRVEAARRAAEATMDAAEPVPVPQFVSFYSSEFIERNRRDEVLAPVERISWAIDVDHADQAVEMFTQTVLAA